MKTYADYIYDIVKNKCEGMDAIYEHYILELVGHIGLDVLVSNRLVETCGTVNGYQLYVLVDRKE